MAESLTLTAQQIKRKKAAGEPIEPDDLELVNRHTIMVQIENSIGSLIRVVNMFSARGFNIESITVGPTDEKSVSRIHIVTKGNVRIISQILRQLSRLVDTIEVSDLTGTNYVERELCLVKVRSSPESRAAILDLNSVFRGKVVDITPTAVMFELIGRTEKIDAFINMMRSYEILEVARSGRVAMQRDEQPGRRSRSGRSPGEPAISASAGRDNRTTWHSTSS